MGKKERGGIKVKGRERLKKEIREKKGKKEIREMRGVKIYSM